MDASFRSCSEKIVPLLGRQSQLRRGIFRFAQKKVFGGICGSTHLSASRIIFRAASVQYLARLVKVIPESEAEGDVPPNSMTDGQIRYVGFSSGE